MSMATKPDGATATGEEQAQQQGAETPKMAENESLTKLISSNMEPMREDQVQNAVKFLSHPKVRGSPVIYRRSFLEKKGLTREEIDEAFRRVPDPPSGANVDNSLSSQANQQKPPSSFPPPVSAAQPTSVSAPATVVSATTPVQQYKFQLSHALLAIGVLAAAGAGSAVVIKKAILPRLKAWIRKVVSEDEAEMKEKPPSAVEEAAQAAKEAATAAALIAKASQELLKSKNEEIKHFEAFKSVLDVQLEEMKLMRNSIYRLETEKESKPPQDHRIRDTSINGPTTKTSGAYQSETKLPFAPKVNRNAASVEYKQGQESEPGFGRPSSAPANVEPTAAPYSKSYMDIMAMIQRGETPPGIKEINDMPPNPDQQLPNPRVAPRTKPWEYNYQDQQRSVSTFPPGNEGYHEQQDNGHSSYMNGSASATSEYPWQKTVKISEVDTRYEERKTIPYGPGSGEWRSRGWVPPQPPSVVIPEAVAAIRQPKLSAQKQQPSNEISVTQYHLSEDGAGGISGTANDTSTSSSQVAEPPSISEIQEEPSSSIEV